MESNLELAAALAPAGLRLLGRVEGGCELVPPVVAGQSASCPPEEGRVDAIIDIDDPSVCEKANAEWYRLSVESGLFGENAKEFLVALPIDGPNEMHLCWYLVEIQDEWDIFGAGASGPLGSGYCRPEFLMLSLDGSVLVTGTTWQAAVSAFAVARPYESQVLRRFAESFSSSSMGSPEERSKATCWLSRYPLSNV